jgi:sec-independent protein translocase protein TatB
MEFLGIGPLELLFILILVLLVFGPKDIERGARSLGQGLSRLYRSENYRLIQKASEELRRLPERLAREANLDELQELKRTTQQELKDIQRIADPTSPEKPFKAWVQELPPDPPGEDHQGEADPPSAPPAATPQARPPPPKDDPPA